MPPQGLSDGRCRSRRSSDHRQEALDFGGIALRIGLRRAQMLHIVRAPERDSWPEITGESVADAHRHAAISAAVDKEYRDPKGTCGPRIVELWPTKARADSGDRQADFDDRPRRAGERGDVADSGPEVEHRRIEDCACDVSREGRPAEEAERNRAAHAEAAENDPFGAFAPSVGDRSFEVGPFGPAVGVGRRRPPGDAIVVPVTDRQGGPPGRAGGIKRGDDFAEGSALAVDAYYPAGSRFGGAPCWE